MLPVIIVARLVALIRPMKSEYRVFYFFSFYHIGGAEKVHAQIAAATGGEDCMIFFTRKSDNDHFRKAFEATGCRIKDISRYTDNKWLYPFNILMRGIISGYINRQKNSPVVFNGQCNFGYKLSPWVRQGVRQIELIHSFNTFSVIRLPFLPFITRTVMISEKRIEDHYAQYERLAVPESFRQRITYISNAIMIPLTMPVKNDASFTVLYAGRGGEEKRLPLIAAIFAILHAIDSRIRFEVMGDVSGVLRMEAYDYILFHGNVSDEGAIREIYQRSSVLILASTTEGFPMVVIEAMAFGLAIVSTPVGDIPRHVRTNEEGCLLGSVVNEPQITREASEWIAAFAANMTLRKSIADHNFAYAREHFGLDQFNKAYREVINPSKNHD